jgi:hypothetical protein
MGQKSLGDAEFPETAGNPLLYRYPELCLDNLTDADIFNSLDRYRCVDATAFPVVDPATGVIKKEIWCIKCDKALELFDEYAGLLPYLSLEKAKLRAWPREGLMRISIGVVKTQNANWQTWPGVERAKV